jgi:spore germination protein GerM
LVPALRPGNGPQQALDRLVAGPSGEETAAGFTTAVPLQQLRLASPRAAGVAVVEVPDEFAGLSGRSRFLAAAQLVWTVTGVCCANRVRLLAEGRVLSVPTDAGSTWLPVRRADFGSVAPSPA